MKRFTKYLAGVLLTTLVGLCTAADLPNTLDRGAVTGIPDGVVTAPGFSFASDSTLGIYKPAANVVGVTSQGKDAVQFTTNSASAVNYLSLVGVATGAGARIEAQGGDAAINILLVPKGAGGFVSILSGGLFINGGSAFKFASNLAMNTAPTINSGFGTSPSIATNGSMTFRVTVGTGGVSNSGIVTMPTAATGWNCQVIPLAPAASQLLDQTVETASTTTSVSVQNQLTSSGSATAWAAGQVLMFICMAF